MDDQLLRELYGVDAENDYTESDDMIKEAQAELVEAVADEAGVDLNEMDDAELEKFASYVLSSDSHEGGYVEDDAYAQADQMGRIMAHAYADEQMKIASRQRGLLTKIAKEEAKGPAAPSFLGKMTGYSDFRRAQGIGAELAKRESAIMGKKFFGNRYRKNIIEAMGNPELGSDIAGSVRSAIVKNDQKALGEILRKSKLSRAQKQALLLREMKAAQSGLRMRGAGKAGLVLGGLGAAGYGVKRALD